MPHQLSPKVLLSRDRARHQQQLADRLLGTLRPEGGPRSIKLPDGQHYHPAWDDDRATHSRAETGLKVTGTDHLLAAARRRASCGQTWHLITLTAQAVNQRGEVLVRRELSGLPSDLRPDLLRAFERQLKVQTLREALDWAILDLN